MKFFAPFRISDNISKTPEGYLLCRNVSIGRTGEMVYGVGEVPIQPGPDGKVIITRSAEELFRPETIASFEGKALTILHPQDFVSPANWSQLTKGVVQNVHRGAGAQENDLVADFLVTVADAIELVENGLREVSCGYEAEYTQTGVGRGFQSDIVGNHVALVEEGRAGSSYAINDHKGKGSTMKVSDKIKAIFAKATDEALKAADCSMDESPKADQEVSGFVTMKDMTSYMDKQFGKLMDAFGGKKEDEPAKDEGAKQDQPEPKAKDAPDLAAVLAKIEERLAKLEKGTATDEEAEADDESEEEEVGDEEEESGETGDSAAGDEDDDDEDDSLAARVEILAPGMKATTKDVKSKAILAAYATEEGKQAIHKFTGGKAPNLKNKATCDALFVGVSEILKLERSEKLAASRPRVRDTVLSSLNGPKGTKSADDINEINAKHFGQKK